MVNNVLTPDMLSDKNRPDVRELFPLAFEYLLAGVSEAHSKVCRLSPEDFNQNNKLQRSLLLSYPFFIALSNGNGHSLYSLYGNFLSFTYGPASMPIQELLPLDMITLGNEQKELECFIIESYKVTKKDVNNTFSQIKNEISNKKLNHYSNGKRRFGEVLIQNDEGQESKLTDAIDNGINILRRNSNDLFFDGNTKRVLELARYFDAWRDKYELSSIEEIRYEEIQLKTRERVYGNSAVVA